MVLETLLLGAMLSAAPRSSAPQSYPIPQSVQMQASIRIGRGDDDTSELVRRYGRTIQGLDPYERE